MVDTQLLQRADWQLDKVSNALRALDKPHTTEEKFELLEEALFNALLALRILVRGDGETDSSST